MHASTLKSTQTPLRLLGATFVIALAAAFAQTAQAQPYGGPGPGARGAMAGHGGMGAGHGMGAGMAMGIPMLSERLLSSVNATPEQRAQIQQIMQAARTDLGAQRDAGRKLHDQARALFVQPAVDARAAEALRVQMLAQHDQASKRMLRAMLDASAVLTPEQRKMMADKLAQRRSLMERHRAERAALGEPTR